MHHYNSTRKPIILREYGRNIQRLVESLGMLKDKSARAARVQEILKLMALLSTHNRQGVESIQKRWNDLFMLSGYSLDVESPYPIVKKRPLDKTSQRLRCNKQPISFRHYGRNIELLIKKAASIQDPKEQEKLIINILRLMKRYNEEWKNDNVGIDTLLANLKYISGNGLLFDLAKIDTKSILSPASKAKTLPGKPSKVASRNRKGE